MREKLAVQLYTLRKECQRHFPEVLRTLASRGWAGVQFAGFHDYDPRELASVLNETGLKAAGLHVGFDQIANNLEQIVIEAELLRTRDIICPSVPPSMRNESGYRQIKRTLRGAAARLGEKGFRISYHNHAYEFDTTVDGRNALDFMLNPAEDNPILAEIDVYWIRKIGLDPTSYIETYTGRMPIIHLKDMTNDDRQTYAEIGTGCIDFKPILQWGERSGVEWYVVEQDVCPRDAMDCVDTSYTHIMRLLSELEVHTK